MRYLDADEAHGVIAGLWNVPADRYDSCKAAVFQKPAEELVRRAGIEEGSRVLDLGTGTGIAAFAALERVGPEGYVLGVDSAEDLLALAKEKAEKKGSRNVEFQLMSMASLDLPAESFDHVIGNYSLCCTPHYERALAEAYRVLKPGGRLTYNHEGPRQHPVMVVYNEIFSKYKVAEPSEAGRQARAAFSALEAGWARFKDPFLALGAMETAGFVDRQATISFRRQVFPNLEGYMDYKFTDTFDLVELSEMGPREMEKLRNDLSDALSPFLSDDGLVLKLEVLHLSGRK